MIDDTKNVIKEIFKAFKSRILNGIRAVFTNNADKLADFIRDTPELKHKIYRNEAKKQLIFTYQIDESKDGPVSNDDIEDFLYRHIESVRPEAEKEIENMCERTMSYNWKAILGTLAVYAFCLLPALHVLISLLMIADRPAGLPPVEEIAGATLAIVILFVASIVAFFMLGKQKR